MSAGKIPLTVKKQPPPTKPKPLLSARKVFESGNGGTPVSENGKENQDPLEVFCRIRPLKDLTDLYCVRQVRENVLQLISPHGTKPVVFYNFKQVFDENTDQKMIFDNVCLNLVKDALDGKNGLLFTYGITSSGKTHTLTGRANNPGLLPRTLDAIFNSIRENQARKFSFKPDGQNGFTIRDHADALLEWQNERQNGQKSATSTPHSARTARQRKQDANELREWCNREKDSSKVEIKNGKNLFSVFVSYIEVYNNYVYDLLDDSVIDQLRVQQKATSKALREDSNKRIFVMGCTEVEVTSSDDAFEVFLRGLRRRKMAHTALNTESSRSHSVFNIRIVQSPMDDAGEVSLNTNVVHVSQLSLVDLAGSERTGRTGTKGERLREAGNINNSLMALRNCLDILRENQKTAANKVVPYRDNKLTHLFKTYFEGEGKVKMIICLNPSACEYDESVHVLKFAETTQEVLIARGTDFTYKLPPSLTPDQITPGMTAVTPNGIHFATLGNFGPPPPTSSLADANNDRVIPEWLEYLEDHKRIRIEKTEELLRNQMIFREQLANMESEVVLLRNQNCILLTDLTAREEQVKKLEWEVSQAQRGKEASDRRTAAIEKQNQALEKEISELRSSLNNAAAEKEKIKQKYMEMIRAENSRVKRLYNGKLSTMEQELKRQNCLNQEKLHLVHDILFRNNEDLRPYHDVLMNRPPSSPPSGTASSSTAPKAPSTPSSPKKRSGRTVSQDREERRSIPQSPVTLSDRSPENAPPVVNPRHRRSLSSGNEKWIDHRPPGTLNLGTVFQPLIRNKKSVSSLKDVTTDTLKHASNYALTHHTADSTGEVETRVFKGDIIPSLSGGAHVVFNDVETLTQEDPLSPTNTRKRAVSDCQVLPSTPSTIEPDTANVTMSKRTRR